VVDDAGAREAFKKDMVVHMQNKQHRSSPVPAGTDEKNRSLEASRKAEW